MNHTRKKFKFHIPSGFQKKLWLFITAVSLLVCLTAACSHSEQISLPEKETAPLESQAQTEQETPKSSEQNAAQICSQFDRLCQDFMIDQLSGSFLNLHYTLLDPGAYGITDYEKSFGDFSLNALKEERAGQKEFQREFEKINPKLLDSSRQLTYRILMDAFEAENAGDGLELYCQPLAPATGTQAQLPILLGEFTFRSRQDIEDYLTLLADIDEYYRQILDFEKEKSQAGLFMTDSCVDQIIDECSGYLLPPENNFMTSAFNQRVDAVSDLSEQEKSDYKSRNQTIVAEHFIPAYQLLTDGLKSLKGTCTNEQGLCFYPQGSAYYEYLVHASTGTTYPTIEALRDAISAQIDSDLSAMAQILKEHPETADQVMDYRFSLTEPTEILEHLKTQISHDFPEIPACSYTTKTVPKELSSTLGPAFFLVPPIDDYDQCVIYVNPDSTSTDQDLYTTLAHEGIPGHMYQNVYFLSNCSSQLRKILSFASYSEGWAFYVENYSYTTDNGLSPALGQILALNTSASLGLHALVDININYFGWTREQVQQFLSPYFNDSPDSSLTDTIYNVMLNTPVNYLNYYVGYLEIIHMKEQAQAALGDRFDLKDFHTFLLDIGPAPFTVIHEDFQTWLNARKTGS